MGAVRIDSARRELKGGILTLASYLQKVWHALRHDGLSATAHQALAFIRYRVNRVSVFSLPSAEARFTKIYEVNYWDGKESRSGHGSSLAFTESLRRELRHVIGDLKIKSIFDAPCGDFNWMRKFLDGEPEVRYIGADIVQPMIRRLQEETGSRLISFKHMDLTMGPFPTVDLMICRDCLFHLSYNDTVAVLRNFLAANIPYLMTTTHYDDMVIENRDIQSAGFRLIDLFSDPYNFSTDPLYVVEDWLPPGPKKKMCLWTRAQVEKVVEGFRPQTDGEQLKPQ